MIASSRDRRSDEGAAVPRNAFAELRVCATSASALPGLSRGDAAIFLVQVERPSRLLREHEDSPHAMAIAARLRALLRVSAWTLGSAPAPARSARLDEGPFEMVALAEPGGHRILRALGNRSAVWRS